MASLYLVRIDEANQVTLTTVGKKMPLLNLEQVRDFLCEYAGAWQQLPPPPVEFIEAEFERQRAEREADGRQMPGTRGCVLELRPYPNRDITHLISITEMSGTIAEGLSLSPRAAWSNAYAACAAARMSSASSASRKPGSRATGSPLMYAALVGRRPRPANRRVFPCSNAKSTGSASWNSRPCCCR